MIGDILAGLATVVSLVAVGAYAAWHNGKDWYLVSDIGKGVSFIVFPGEADLRSLQDNYTRPQADLTNLQPCNLCLLQPNAAPLPGDPMTWKGKGGVNCSDADAPNKWSQILSPAVALQWQTVCGSTRPDTFPDAPGVVIDACMGVKGIGGFAKRGMPPRTYILKRLFNARELGDNMQYNRSLFKGGSPYQTQRVGRGIPDTKSGSGQGYNYSYSYKYSLDSYYACRWNDPTTRNNGIPFVPPLMNKSKWIKNGDFWYSLDGVNYQASFTGDPTVNTGPNSTAQFDSFPAKCIIVRGDRKYMSLEWAPGSKTASDPPPFEEWSKDEKACIDYINTYMSCNSYAEQAVAKPKA